MRRIFWFLLGATCFGTLPLLAQSIGDGPGAQPAIKAVATAAQYLSWYPRRALTTDTVWNAGPQYSYGTVSSGSITPNFCSYTNMTVTLGATGLTLANPTCFQVGQFFEIDLVQDGTGSRTITTYGSYYKFTSNGAKPTLTTTAAATDSLFCMATAATVIKCNFGLNYN